jgi:hypothetical protein
MTQQYDYPETEDGEPDYEFIATQLNIQDASPVRPIFVNDGTDTFAITSVDTDRGSVVMNDAYSIGVIDQWETDLVGLWIDWMYDSLHFRRRTFLNVEDKTYNSECEAAVSRLTLAELADWAYNDSEHLPNDVLDAIAAAYDALEYVEGAADVRAMKERRNE